MAGSTAPEGHRSSYARLVEGAGFALKLCFIAVCLISIGTSTASAQDGNPFSWFRQWFQPAPPPPSQYYYPARPRIRNIAPKPRLVRPKASPIQGAEKPANKPAVPPSYFVAVLGDSLGQMLAQGLAEAFTDRPGVAILRKAKENSGLVRDDFYDCKQRENQHRSHPDWQQ
jgi:hypothetical protein